MIVAGSAVGNTVAVGIWVGTGERAGAGVLLAGSAVATTAGGVLASTGEPGMVGASEDAGAAHPARESRAKIYGSQNRQNLNIIRSLQNSHSHRPYMVSYAALYHYDSAEKAGPKPTRGGSVSDYKEINAQVIIEFRANHGIVGGQFRESPLLLLTTIGAKSGQQRTIPLVYTTDAERLVILASKGGAPTHPDWYYNMLANPHVTVEVGDERFQTTAEFAEGPERERLFAQMAAAMPFFARYQRETSRQIPVVILKRPGA